MDYKKFIKLDNIVINLEKIQYLEFSTDELLISIKESESEIMNFQFDSKEYFERFKSYIQMYSTEFLCKRIEDSKQKILVENAK